jgi:hypothetical protein
MEGNPLIVAGVLAAVFIAISALHVYWAARGVMAGADAVTVGGAVPVRADGSPLFRPGPLATLAVAVLLAAAAVVVLGRAGVVAPVAPPSLYRAGTWVLGGVLLLLRAIGDFRYVGIFRRERHSRFARMDTVLYTPLCALLAAGVFYLAAH